MKNGDYSFEEGGDDYLCLTGGCPNYVKSIENSYCKPCLRALEEYELTETDQDFVEEDRDLRNGGWRVNSGGNRLLKGRGNLRDKEDHHFFETFSTPRRFKREYISSREGYFRSENQNKMSCRRMGGKMESEEVQNEGFKSVQKTTHLGTFGTPSKSKTPSTEMSMTHSFLSRGSKLGNKESSLTCLSPECFKMKFFFDGSSDTYCSISCRNDHLFG